jgi:hypothetical protein
MRMGARTGRGTFVAMGPVGWIVVLPFVIMYLTAKYTVLLCWYMGVGMVKLCQALAHLRSGTRAELRGEVKDDGTRDPKPTCTCGMDAKHSATR